MGNGKTKQYEDEQYILQDINKISLNPGIQKQFVWIDGKIYNGENQKYYARMKEKFKVQCYTSLEGARSILQQCQGNQTITIVCAASLPDQDYRQMNQQDKFDNIILFCQTSTRADLLMKNFAKIKKAAYNFGELIQSMQNITQTVKNYKYSTNALFMIESDTNQINRYRLNYACLCKPQNEQQSKNDFIKLANHLFPKQTEDIDKFKNQYNHQLQEQQKYKIFLKQCFKPNSFVWKMIYELSKLTTDSRKLGYLRLAYKYLFKGIKTQYDLGKKYKRLYIVHTLSQEELAKIQQDQFIIFPSFIKGFVKQEEAYQHLKENQHCILFQVVIKNIAKMDKELDFGYYIDQTVQGQNVIFNIYNFFTFGEINENDMRTLTIQYGSLASASWKRKDVKDSTGNITQKRERLQQTQKKLVRNYDYLEDLMKKVNSQAAILQMSGNFKDSLQVYQKKLKYLRQSTSSIEVIDKSYLDIGDGLRINQLYDEAEKQYSKIQSQNYKLIAKVHIMQLYYKKGETNKFKKILQQIKENLPLIEKINREEQFKTRNYVAISLMNQGKFKQANSCFKQLMNDMPKFYDYKYQGIPLVHDIFRNAAFCESKLKNFTQAISLLSSAKQWQMVCQGKSPNVALTQTIMHQVYVSKGDQNKIKQSQISMQNIKKSYKNIEAQYINRSRMVNLNQSTVNIVLEQPIQIKQSSVNIKLD